MVWFLNDGNFELMWVSGISECNNSHNLRIKIYPITLVFVVQPNFSSEACQCKPMQGLPLATYKDQSVSMHDSHEKKFTKPICTTVFLLPFAMS